MTLIAGTIKKNTLLIISDILMTTNAERSIRLPTNKFDIDKYIEIQKKPVALKQKTYIINDKVCITFAGSEYEIKRFLTDFKLRCKYYDNISRSDIAEYLDGYDLKREFSQSAFLISLIDNQTQSVFQLPYPSEYWQEELGGVFDTTYACGSGKRDFLSWVKAYSENETFNQQNMMLQSLSLSSCFVARLLAIERFTLHTIKNQWGGGYEATFIDGFSFVKFDNIAYIIFYGDFDEKGRINSMIPGLVLYYKYRDDILHIHSVEAENFKQINQGRITTFISSECTTTSFIVPPIDIETAIVDTDTHNNVSFQTNRIGVGCGFITQHQVFTPSYFIENTDFSVVYENGNVCISIDTQMHQRMLNGAISKYPNLQ